MKTRTDFVSNSSSTSFVIHHEGNAVISALEAWSRDFTGIDVPYTVESVTLNFRTSQKSRDKVRSAFAKAFPDTGRWQEDTSGPYTYNVYDDSWSFSVSFYELPEIWTKFKNSDVLNDITEIEFYGSDNDFMLTLYMKMLYLYFDRNLCMPDCSCSERSFLDDDCDDQSRFINKLCTSSSKIARKKEKQQKSLQDEQIN